MEDKKKEMQIPGTVGEMIDFLKQFPRDRTLDIYYMDQGDYGDAWESPAYRMKFQELGDYGSVEITLK